MLLDCLVVRQPYASLIALGHKRWEFRKYDSRKRGITIGIAASPNNPLTTQNIVLNRFKNKFPRGVVLATGRLVTSFFITSADLKAKMTDPVFTNIHGLDLPTLQEPIGEPLEDVSNAIKDPGWQQYAWLIDNVKPLKEPIPLPKLQRSTWIKVEVPVGEI